MLKNVLIVIVALFINSRIFACICLKPTLEKEWNYSSHIFTGKVITIKQYSEIYLLGENNHLDYLLIEIQQSFKGFYNIPKYITLIKSHTSCDRNYEENQVYIFYCSTFMGTELMFAPDSCSRTIDTDHPDYTNEIIGLNKLRSNEPQTLNSKSYRIIEERELNNLRNDAILSDELLQKNKILKTIFITLATVLAIIILSFLYKKIFASKSS